MTIPNSTSVQWRPAVNRRLRWASGLPGGCIAALCMDEVVEPLEYPEPAGSPHYPKGSGDATLGAPVARPPLQARMTTRIEDHP